MKTSPQSEMEKICGSYFRKLNRLSDWVLISTPEFWLFALLLPISIYALVETLSALLTRRTGVTMEVVSLTAWLFVAYGGTLLASHWLRGEAANRKLLRLATEENVHAANLDEARIALLSEAFAVQRTEFLEIAEQLEKIQKLKSAAGVADSSFWVRTLHTIYDPSSKPRILALFAILIALIIAFTRAMEFEPDAIFILADGFSASSFAVIFYITAIAWLYVVLLTHVSATIEAAASSMDVSNSHSANLRNAIRDLVRYSIRK